MFKKRINGIYKGSPNTKVHGHLKIHSGLFFQGGGKRKYKEDGI